MHLAIAGNIGAGKTTLTQLLAEHYGWEAILEPVDYNPYLSDFYADMAQWSFHLQTYFLGSRFKHVLQLHERPRNVVQDRSIYEDAYIFARNLYTSGLMSERDYGNYLQLFEAVMRLVRPPDLLVYLRADLPKLTQQIRKRGRNYEKNISPAYLQNLNEHYEKWIAGYRHGKLLIIDVNKTDFLGNSADLNDMIRRIDEAIRQNDSAV